MARRRRRYRSSRWGEPDWIDVDALDDDLPGDPDLDDFPDSRSFAWVRPATPSPPPPVPRGWKQEVDQIASTMQGTGVPWPAGREILYVISVPETLFGGSLALDIGCRQRKKNGEWRHVGSFRLSAHEIDRLPDPADRQILAMLSGASGVPFYTRSMYPGSQFIRYYVPAPLLGSLLPLIVRTGRASLCVTRSGPYDLSPVVWDDGPPWEFRLDVSPDGTGKHYRVTGVLRRGAERLDVSAPVLLLAGGFVCLPDRVARLDDGGAFPWVSHLRRIGELRVPADQARGFLDELLRMPTTPRHDLPPDLSYETLRPAPRPRLRVERAPSEWPLDLLRLELSFEYDGLVILADRPARGAFQPERRRLILRDAEAERAAHERLMALGPRMRSYTPSARERSYPASPGVARALALAARALPRVASTLLGEGWHVEADGRLYRQPGAFRLSVTTAVDWFELHGTMEFGDTAASLPALLVALRRGESTVLLGDGTYGVLPEEWLRRYGPLAGLGTPDRDHLRFTRAQVGLLDAMLAAQPEITCDALFTRARDELRRFEGIRPADPPETFSGRLRGYQREGLGWLHFLRQFDFGGCLADDMGLGKTVMVLALLESRRIEAAKNPSLVVVPRSLVFNWKQEAARFTPALRVLDHTGVARRPQGERFAEHDVVLTTYGTLRRDIFHFKDIAFDYVILDEAQAIKNASTDVAKAARLLRGDHRLALSGTPVENHLGELWSLFEFLNPGMLGAARLIRDSPRGALPTESRPPLGSTLIRDSPRGALPTESRPPLGSNFGLRLDGAASRSLADPTRALLAPALRPFILRRTKAQVAPELPSRVEQTVYCELEPLQRRLYDELRDHYRRSLLGRIDREGIKRSTIVVLEALLRLRQAACHPGLIDKTRVGEPAGKLDVLLPRLTEVIEEGHKALVFSQFTSFLGIVRRRLDRERIRYEYLDGATRDRDVRVGRFQSDPDCRLFLVSLKAGGLGLNLTAAEHVFLLDPWWNPAAEAQAIDRAHRIGQTRHVLAFRLIARDTVEEKILALQAEKRELADAIINEQNSLIRTLTREDLELLLS